MTDSTETETPAARPTESKVRRAAVRWGRLCCLGATGVFVLAEVAGGRWPIVLLTPYLPQMTAVALLGVVMLFVSTRRRRTKVDFALIGLAAVAMVYGGVVTLGLVPWRTIPAADKVVATDTNLGRVKVMIANVHTSNPDHQTLLKVIAEEDPDIVLLPEVNDVWARDLRTLSDRYPVRAMMPDSLGNFGMAFYSRLPGTADWFTAVALGQDDAYAVPQIDAKLSVADASGVAREFRFFGLHPLPPIKAGNTQARDAVLAKVTHLAAFAAPSIVAGDLNATRYCNVMRTMADPGELIGGLKDAASHLRFSWPNTWSWWAMGIRIDHVLTSHNWHVVDCHAGRDIGSDHLPIVATLQLVRESR